MLWTRKPKYFAVAEYWLYVPKAKLPPQEAYMARMTRVHPFAPGEPPPCGKNEALVFSDIRFHMALVLRKKNPHAFRPDLFNDDVEPSAEALAQIANCEAFVKCMYLSDVPLKDDRHLQFLVYLVEAVSHLTRGAVVFDSVCERLQLVSDVRDSLRENLDATRSDLHLRTTWIPGEIGGVCATKGLRKIGLPELQTPASPADQRILIQEILEDAANQLWNRRELVDRLQVHAYGDAFDIQLQYRRKGPAVARIMRIHG